MPQEEKTPSWYEINNWIPIITTAILICGSFMLLKSDMRVANRNIELLLAGQTQLIEKYEGVQKRLGECELSISTLQTRMGIGSNKL